MQAPSLRVSAAGLSACTPPPPPRRAVAARSTELEAPGAAAGGPPPPPSAPACDRCGAPLSEAPRGCVDGRIAGGIGAVPGFTWWPIKAYRPCPALEASGRGYTRKGQITDEMLFGKKGKGPPPQQ